MAVLIRFSPNDLGQVEWLSWAAANGQEGVKGGRATLSSQPEALRSESLSLVIPAEEVTLKLVSIPAKSQRQLLKAVPFALEDELIEEVDTLHFAVAAKDSEGRVPVAVVAQARMENFLGLMRNAGLSLASAIPEQLLLPYDPGTWTLLVERDRAVVRTAAYAGFACDVQNLPLLLQASLEESEQAPSAIAVYHQAPGAPRGLDQLGIELRTHALPSTPLALYRFGLDQGKPLDLLQGAFKQKDTGPGWRRWRVAAVLAGIWLVSSSVFSSVDFLRLSAEDEELDSKILEILKDTFPDVQGDHDAFTAQRIMSDRIEGLSTPVGNTVGMFELASAFANASGVIPDLNIRNMSYREGRLDLSLTAPDLQSLDVLRQRLDSTKVKAEILSSTSQGSLVSGNFRLEEAPQ